MIGPLPASMSKGIPMPVSGVRMSENRMTPSGLKARQGCSDTSTCIGSSVRREQAPEKAAGACFGVMLSSAILSKHCKRIAFPFSTLLRSGLPQDPHFQTVPGRLGAFCTGLGRPTHQNSQRPRQTKTLCLCKTSRCRRQDLCKVLPSCIALLAASSRLEGAQLAPLL